MRIAIVVTKLFGGGLETVLKYLADELILLGHKVSFIEDLGAGKWSQYYRGLGYEVISIDSSPWRSRVSQARAVQSKIGAYDLLLLNEALMAQSALGFLPPETLAIPVVHLHHPGFYHNAAANFDQVDCISTVSKPLEQAITQRYPYLSGYTVTINNGVQVAESWPKQNSSFQGGTPLKVIILSRIEKIQKGVLHLPPILEPLWKKGLNITLEIVGDGPDLPELKQRFALYPPSQEKITYHGFVEHDEALTILAQSDVLIMPSYFEGMPIALLEAMGRGVVPIVSKLPGMTTPIVEDGKNGFLPPPVDESLFSQALLTLYTDRAQLRTLSEAAWQTVQTQFSSKLMAENYLNLFTQAQGARASGKRIITRSHKLDYATLGEFPLLPPLLGRILRKARTILKRLFNKA
ncbi:MAG: glycosyltransferase family 4 protein [Magnetococcales bacterium]|nr:glycosyltransferase family 4 protein [Magnetococcales bacterium]